MRRRAEVALRAALRGRFGIWPVYELRNKVLGWPQAVASQRFEHREVERLRPTCQVPPALVTTIVPTFRRPESLVRAVHSALAQDLTEHTVIVVDDGGGLPGLPDDDRLVVVALARNTGLVGVVRNVGIALARSPYLAFLDDDNEWRPDHLRRAVGALRQGADVVYTAVERVHPDGTVMDVLSQPFDRRTLREESYVDTNGLVVRNGKGVRYSRIPRTKATLPKEDWEFAWRLSRRRRTVHVPAVTVRYVVNPESYYTDWSGDERPHPTTGVTR
jgi:glycosyltransferase involved in cell wall biosynthesis